MYDFLYTMITYAYVYTVYIYIHITSIQWIFITITQRAVVLLGQYIHIRLLIIIIIMGCTYLPPAYLT